MELAGNVKVKYSKAVLTGGVITLLFAAVLGLGFKVAFADKTLSLEHKHTKTDEVPVFLGEVKFEDSFPLGVLTARDKLYITFFQQERVGVFSPTGEKLSEFTAKVQGEKGYPMNLALFNDKLVITDYVNGTIGLYTLDGKALDGFWTDSEGQALKPVAATAHKNVMYVTDEGFKGFLAIQQDGEILNAIKPDNPESKLYFPWGIAITKDGRVLITDFNGSRVKVFDCAGRYAHDIEAGRGDDILNSPQGIAIDGLERVHVVDKVKNKVFVYDKHGKFKFVYGGKLNGPTGITIDHNKRVIYVANTENNSISIWGY